MERKEGTNKSSFRKAAVLALLFLCALLAAGCQSHAWFETDLSKDFTVDFGSAEITSRVYFEGLPASDPLNTPENGFYKVKVMQAERGEPNYISNMRIDVYFKGISAYYIRVYIAESWVRTVKNLDGTEEEEILRNVFTRYSFGANSPWIDNRRSPDGQVNDSFFYYNNPASASADKYEVSCTQSDGSVSEYITIPLITGFDRDYIDALYPLSGTALKVKVLAEAVQVNRYKQLWQIESLPVRV